MIKENVQRVRDLIASLPQEKVQMSRFLALDRPSETVQEAAAPTCNTAGCIAGWAFLLFCPQREEVLVGRGGYDGSRAYVVNHIGVTTIQEEAASYLGLTPRESEHLFLGAWETMDCGPEQDCLDYDFDEQCHCYDLPGVDALRSITKEQVLTELDHFLTTGRI